MDPKKIWKIDKCILFDQQSISYKESKNAVTVPSQVCLRCASALNCFGLEQYRYYDEIREVWF